MGALGKSIPIRGDGDREAAHEAVWVIIRDFVVAHLSSADQRVADGYTSCLRDEDDDRSPFSFMFPDGGGGCTRSKYAWVHWTEVAVARAWDTIDACVRSYGLALDGERWSHHRDGELVELRDRVWHIQDNCLHGDNDALEYDELDKDETARVDAARTVCACPMCTRPGAVPMFRPRAASANEVAAVVKILTDRDLVPALRDRSLAAEAARRLSSSGAATAEILLALVTAEAPMPQLVDSVRSVARAVDAWDVLVAAYPRLASGERGLALYAFAAMTRDEARTAWLVDQVRRALANNDRNAEAAAEVSGSLGVDLSAELDAVLHRLGVDAELRAKVECAIRALRSNA